MKTAYLHGIEARIATITVKPANLPGLQIQGLGEAATREARVRIQAALATTCWPQAGAVVEIGPQTAKDGCGFDLPIALALSGCDGAAAGELSLKGEIRPIRGILPIVEALRDSGAKTVVVAVENQAEARLAAGVRIVACKTLLEAKDATECSEISEPCQVYQFAAEPARQCLDMAEVRGQEAAKADLEAVAISGEPALLVGPMGAGKTMLARRFISILPGMTHVQAMETTRIASAAGLNIGGGLVSQRPFRAPHHSTSATGLVGGGTGNPRPGEISLAHNGVLFLDEVAEFGRSALEAMREPVQAGEVVLTRASGTARFPARCQILAGTNPCLCGRFGGPMDGVGCRCSSESIKRYQDRIDAACGCLGIKRRIKVELMPLTGILSGAAGESSATIRARVAARRAATGRD